MKEQCASRWLALALGENISEIQPLVSESQSDPDSDKESIVHQNQRMFCMNVMFSVVSIFRLFKQFVSLLACNWQWLTVIGFRICDILDLACSQFELQMLKRSADVSPFNTQHVKPAAGGLSHI